MFKVDRPLRRAMFIFGYAAILLPSSGPFDFAQGRRSAGSTQEIDALLFRQTIRMIIAATSRTVN
jgi:hypothetical protein